MIDRNDIIELIREQIKDQCGGKLETDFEYLQLLQSHIWQWINLFGITKEELEC